MKKQQNFFSQMGNLTFYSPRNKDAYQESPSVAEKSQKFFRNMISKQSADDLSNTNQNSLSGAHVRMNTLNEEFGRDVSAFDPEQQVTTSTIPEVVVDPNTHKAPSDIIKVIGSSKVAKFPSKTLDNKLPSSPHLREFLELKSDKTIREETREYEETGGDIDKVYKSAHHFQNLQTNRDKESVAKYKLSDDKRNQAFSHLNSVRQDISHIFNHKPAKSLSQTSKILPEIQQLQQQSPPRLTKLLSEKGSGAQSPSESNYDRENQNKTGGQSFGNILSYSLGPAASFRLIDNSLQDSKFFSSPTNSRRRNVVHNALQKDIHSVQSPLSKGAYSSHRSPRDKSPEPSAFLAIFDQSDGSPYSQLKRELPSVFSNAPTNRQEVIQLGSWLSNTLKIVQENKELTGKEKFYKADEIYNICFNELVRQVSLDCIERGELIMTIWKAYLALSEDIIDDIKEKEEKAEERSEKKCQKIHEMYNDILKAKGDEIEALKQKLNEYEITNKELQDAAKTFNQRDKENYEEITKLKEVLTKVKKSYNHVQQEHRDLQYKFQKLKKAMDMVEDDNSEDPQGVVIPKLSTFRKQESQDFSISSSDSEETGRAPFAFGNVQHKVVTYVDRSVVFEHPNGFTEAEMQTDLVLFNEQYDRILATQETIDNFILEEAARAHLMQAAQLMENLAETAPEEPQPKEENEQGEDKQNNESVAQDTLPSDERRVRDKLKQTGRAGRGTKKGKGKKDKPPGSKLEISIPSQNNTPDVSKDLLRTETSQKTIETVPETVPEAQEEAKPVVKEEPVVKEVKEVKETKKSEPVEKKEEAKKNTEKAKPVEKGKDVKKAGKGPTASPVKETQPVAAKKEETKTESPAKNQAAANKKPVEPPKPVKQVSPVKETKPVKVEKETKETKPAEKPVEKPIESNTEFNETIVTSNYAEQFEDKSIISYLETKRTEVEPTITEPIKPVPEKVSPPVEEVVVTPKEEEEEVKVEAPKEVKKIEKKPTIRKVVVEDPKEKEENPEEEPEKPTETDITSIPMETPGLETIQTEANRDPITLQTEPVEQVITENGMDEDMKAELRPELKDASTSPLRSPTKKDGGDQTFTGKTDAEVIKLVSRGSLEEVMSEKVDATPNNAKGRSVIKLVSQKTIPSALKAEIDENLKNAEAFAEKQEQRIIQLMNMYKVEKKKQEDLTGVNTQLEQQYADAQVTIANMKEFIEDLQKRLQSSELNKDKLNTMVKNLESKTRAEINDSKTGSSTSLIDISKMTTKKDGWKPTSKKIMNINDPILEASIVPQPNMFRGNANLPAATALARKNYILDKKNNPTQAAIAKVQKAARAAGTKSTDVIPVKSVLKQITSFYIEKMQMARENQLIKDQDMATFIYRQFINTYGFQQFAIKKYTKFMMSVRKYVNIHRVKIFSKMLGMMEDAVNYTPDETKQYVTGMEFLLTNTTAGLHYPNPEYEKKHFTPFLRAIEYIRIFGEQRMTMDDMVNLKKEIEKNKVFDPTGRNLQGLVDIDEFLEMIVSRYRSIMVREKERLEPIFLAGDPAKQGGIIFIEFMMLYRTVEGPKYEDKKMEDAFVSNCDMLVNEEIALSFKKFLAVCFDLDILSEEKQDLFIDVSNEEDIEIKFNELSDRWNQEKSNLTEMISRKQAVVPMEIVREWMSSVAWISDQIDNPGSFTEQKAALLKHRILIIDITNITS